MVSCKRRKYLLFSFLLLFYFPSESAPMVDYNSNCKKANEAVFLLKFSEAKRIIAEERKANPQNIAPDLIENYSDCMMLFISENKQEFEKLKPKMDERLKKFDNLDKSSPYFLFSKAEIYFFWVAVKIKFGEYYSATIYAHRAYKLLEENKKKFPDFLPNNLYLGLMHAAIGAVPDQYKWLVSLAGFKGTIFSGIAELEQLANVSDNSDFHYLKNEAMLLLSLTSLNLQKNPYNALKKAEELYAKIQSPLTSFLYSNVLLHAGENDKAILVMEKAKYGNDYFHIYYLDYLTGLAKLNRMDQDADTYFEKFLTEFQGMHYIKAGYQKLAWFHMLKGNKEKYREYMEKAKSNGFQEVDEDKQAQIEAESVELPNVILLRARLLFDGGYYAKALSKFSGTSINDFPTLKNQLEVTYRIARIYHKQKEFSKAIDHYQETLKNGYNLSFYFAANSALQLGLIYEEQNDFQKAEFYFRKCMSLKNHEYQNSIDQKAKAGLNRISAK